MIIAIHKTKIIIFNKDYWLWYKHINFIIIELNMVYFIEIDYINILEIEMSIYYDLYEMR